MSETQIVRGVVTGIRGRELTVKAGDGSEYTLEGYTETPGMFSLDVYIGKRIKFEVRGSEVLEILDEKACPFMRRKVCTFCLGCKVHY